MELLSGEVGRRVLVSDSWFGISGWSRWLRIRGLGLYRGGSGGLERSVALQYFQLFEAIDDCIGCLNLNYLVC